MMRCGLVLLVVSGCGGGRAAPVAPAVVAPAASVPEVRFAIARDDGVAIVRTTATGLVVERTTPMPAVVSRMFWVGPEPVVWLDLSRGWAGEGFPEDEGAPWAKPHGPHVNAQGLVTATGFVRFAPLAWPPATRTAEVAGAQEITTPNAALEVWGDALWEKRCRWYGGPDGGWCTYEYARRWPAPVAFVVGEAGLGERAEGPAFPDVAPAARIELATDTRLRAPDADPEDLGTTQALMTCSIDGAPAITYPPAGDVDEDVAPDVTWLSTEPPRFRTTQAAPYVGVGRMPPDVHVIWEGCAPSTRFEAATPGPHGLVVLWGREVLVLWRGREIGRLPQPGRHAVFAPSQGA